MVKNAFIYRANCPFCKSKNINTIYSKKYLSKDIKTFLKQHLNNFPINILRNKDFIVMECADCTGIFQKNILNKKFTNRFYDKYVPHDVAFIKKKKNFEYLSKVQSYEVLLIKRYFKDISNIKVLEIGAGWGFWSINAKKNNLDITTVELSKTRRKYLKKNKINVYASVDAIDKKFDFIFADQTFEHLSHPYDYLKKVSKLLNKEGVIYLKVPPGIYIKKKLKKDYRFCEDEIIPLEHINVFNRKVNKIMANKLGIKYSYPINIYNFFSKEFFKKNLINFYEYYSSKTIIFRKR